MFSASPLRREAAAVHDKPATLKLSSTSIDVRRNHSSLTVLFLAEADENHPSSRVRVHQYVPFLERMGFRCRVLSLWPTAALGHARYNPNRIRAGLAHPRKLLTGLLLARRYMVVFVHLSLFPIWAQRLLFRQNPNVIFDFVDPIFLSSQSPSVPVETRRRRLAHMLMSAKAVLVENGLMGELASRYNPSVHVITGPVDTERFAPGPGAKPGHGVVVGWIGTSSTSRYLGVAREALRRTLQAFPEARIELIGAERAPLDGVPFVNHRWSIETELGDLRRFDIGIMPLPDDNWTRGKGGYKLLQYMAMGIPAIASPVGINSQLIQDGVNGYLAANQDEWVMALARLVQGRELRRRLGENGRRIAEERYSLRGSLPKMVEIIRNSDRTGARGCAA